MKQQIWNSAALQFGIGTVGVLAGSLLMWWSSSIGKHGTDDGAVPSAARSDISSPSSDMAERAAVDAVSGRDMCEDIATEKSGDRLPLMRTMLIRCRNYRHEANIVMETMSEVYRLDELAREEIDDVRRSLLRSQEATLIRQTMESAVRCTLDYHLAEVDGQEDLHELIECAAPFIGDGLAVEMHKTRSLCNYAIHRKELFNERERFFHAVKIPGKMLHLIERCADGDSTMPFAGGD
ncbi:hypothetical protein [Bifidobacterium saguinibicoloris]|uniref:hypothetical protein n=1 Tax=Bifidobacterium saguinibicoloris TaxID=2834433 RepID=UPI001C58B9E2|nr:hypothetical protein [Bifidobacterium saguinibicoloris]MBW3080455.1 hypothetical protein [Bifidobacterium saguinibicoloris]